MTILEMARVDAKRIIENGGFQTTIKFENIDSLTSATISGNCFVTHLSFDTEGQSINSRKAHLTFCEKSLTDLNYKTRNYNGEVFFKGNYVSFTDSTGVEKKYSVKENFADETLGIISLILTSFGK